MKNLRESFDCCSMEWFKMTVPSKKQIFKNLVSNEAEDAADPNFY